jgi:ParB family chromosome partitioning protein
MKVTTAKQQRTLKSVPIDRIDPDPHQPRKLFDQAKLEELAASLRELGQVQPITLRYIPATRRYMLIAGERRWRAAKIAELAELDALVLRIEDNDPTTFAKAMAENLGRTDMTPMEEASGFKDLEDRGFDVEKIAKMCGRSEPYVKWRMDLLTLVPAVQEAVNKGHLPVGLAWYTAHLSADNQARFLARYIQGEFPSARDAEAFVQRARAAEREQAEQGGGVVLAEPSTGDTQEVVQDAVFGSLEIGDEERERIAGDRKKLLRKLDKLADAGAILAEIAAMDPEGIAVLLSGAPGGVGAAKYRIEQLQSVATKAVKQLREGQAAALIRANAITVDPELVAEQA